MLPHERISNAIAKANEKGRTGLVPFITAGYPDPGQFLPPDYCQLLSDFPQGFPLWPSFFGGDYQRSKG